MRRKQIFNLFLQRFVARTTFSNEGRALAWVALKHGVKDSIDLLPTFPADVDLDPRNNWKTRRAAAMTARPMMNPANFFLLQ